MQHNIAEIIILAVDPSTELVGWCVSQGNQHVASGTVDLSRGRKKVDLWVRLGRLQEWMAASLAQWSPQVVVCEEPTGDHDNRWTDRRLGNAQGIVFAEAHRHGLPFIVVSPFQARNTGFSKASKLSMTCAAAFAGKDQVGEDEADAIGVGQAGLVVLRERALMALWESQNAHV
jgi:Holliday junction resolvasome RuvABC endonuclease subunit